MNAPRLSESSSDIRRFSISPPMQRLIELLRKVDFGSIEELAVVDGEPVLDPPPKVVRIIKLKEGNHARIDRDGDDFTLKGQVVQLLACLREIENGTIRRIEVQDGLPFKVVVEGVGDQLPGSS
jgi:hypothetical protein